MRQVRWQRFTPILHQVKAFQDEMNQLLHRYADSGQQDGFTAAYPAVNVWEDENHVFVEAELPGLDPKDLELHVTGGNQLYLKGERKPQLVEKAVLHRQERGFGTFARTLTLPFHVNSDNVDANYENGVLLVKLAKLETAKPRKIAVKGE